MTALKTAIHEISDGLLSKYAKLIYDIAGVHISSQKKALLSNRLRRRLKVTGIESYEAYYKHLRTLPANDSEWDAFLQEMTTHETYLFRDEIHWKWFQNDFLPAIISQSRRGERGKTLRIWSAACSTGDEAYTIASCIVGNMPMCSQWKIQIVGTDIGIGAVNQAKDPEFCERAMRLVPDNFKKKYFTQVDVERVWKPKSMLTKLTNFKHHNLMEPLREMPFDLVLLKNVLIYFDKTSKIVVLEHLRKMMRPGSLLLCGAAEGASDFLHDFERVESWLYRLP